MKYRVLGAHANGNFFDLEVVAVSSLAAFGAAALLLKEADEEGDAEFFAAIPAGGTYHLPGEGVVTLSTVLDPEQADVFGLTEGVQLLQGQPAGGEPQPKLSDGRITAVRIDFETFLSKRPEGSRNSSKLFTRHPENPHWYALHWVNEVWLAWLHLAGESAREG